MPGLSPLSVPYRVLQRGGSLLAAAAIAIASGGMGLGFGFGGLAGSAALVALLGVGVLLLTGYELAYYRRYRYELTPDTFDIQSGVFARRDREIPLRRIQNVDISRNVVQRVVGIAAVDFETAGGSETEASLRFVDFEEAKHLQREIARLKRGADAPDDESATELFALSDRELALVGALSFDVRLPGVLALLLSGSAPVVSSVFPRGGIAVLAGVVVVVLLAIVVVSWLIGAAVAVVNYYGFRLLRTDDDLQYERGLLQRYDGSIPFDKIQTLTVEDTPLKRYFGYATLLIETAGYAPGQSAGGGRGSEAAVPLARRDRVAELANDIDRFGDPDFERPPKRVRRRYAVRYLLALGVVTLALAGVDAVLGGGMPRLGGGLPWYGTALVVPLVPVAAHLKWKHRGYWLGDRHVVTRNGVLKRRTKVVPYDRIQTVIDTRTIFQRRWRVATVTIDTAGSLSIVGGDAAAVDVDREMADRLRAELDQRLREALAERRRRRGGARRALVGDASTTDSSAADGSSPERRPGADEDGGADSPTDADGFVWDTAREVTNSGREANGLDDDPDETTVGENAESNGRD